MEPLKAVPSLSRAVIILDAAGEIVEVSWAATTGSGKPWMPRVGFAMQLLPVKHERALLYFD